MASRVASTIVLLGLLASACSLSTDGSHRPGPADASSADTAAATTTPVQSDEQFAEDRGAVQAVLDRRARALRTGNLQLFLSDLYQGDRRFVKLQKRYFVNLRQLPLQVFDYDVLREQWNPTFAAEKWESSAYIPFVRLRMQLQGFDDVPVVSRIGLTFVEQDGRWLLVSDTDLASQVRDGVQEAPWDLTRIKVRRTDDVLAIFDAGSIRRSQQVLTAVEDGIQLVSDVVPFPWDGRVVVYATDDKQVLSAIDFVPGSDVDELGALAFPVAARDNLRKVASVRFLMHPDSLRVEERHVRALVAHELTHVALAKHQGGVPVWLSEGLAEYVSMRGFPRSEWWIPTEAVKRARRGTDELPSVGTFNVIDQPWNYALSWMACDYIGVTYGEAKVWELLREMHDDGRGTGEDEQDRVLRRVLGIDSKELARRAADRIASSFVLS